jgi:hypothetical protein
MGKSIEVPFFDTQCTVYNTSIIKTATAYKPILESRLIRRAVDYMQGQLLYHDLGRRIVLQASCKPKVARMQVK